MNRKMYWVLRKKIKNIVFWIKRVVYWLIENFRKLIEYRYFRQNVIKYSMIEISKGILLSVCILKFDHLLLEKKIITVVDCNSFIPFIIGGIGIAGVILGLYCSSVATIYSTRYANAPRTIANAFQYDRLTRKCVSGIVDYIVFGIIILTAIMMQHEISLMVVISSAIWSVAVIVSYSIAGNRAYQLSDVYSIADDANRILNRIITKRLHQVIFCTDVSFQNYFMQMAEKQIDILKSIQTYGENESGNDHTTMTEFMCKNLAIVEAYWEAKKDIGRYSMWFRDTPKFQRWHLINNTESSLALHTGTALRTKGEHNYWWFEDEVFSINRASIRTLFECKDYTLLNTYLRIFNGLCRPAIAGYEANYYVSQIDLIRLMVENSVSKETLSEEAKKAFAGVVDAVSLLYLSLILETSKLYQEFDFQSIVSSVLKSIDKGDNYEKSVALRRRGDKEFYENIITEIKVEGKRITPDWVIKQQVAKDEYVYLNSLLDIVREGLNHAFGLGETFLNEKLYFEACIIFTRFYEYESKISRFINVVNNRKSELDKYHVDKELIWDPFRLNQLQETMSEWKKEIPALLAKCSCHFALDNWDNSENFPDFLGESFNHICEDAVDAIISNDIEQFSVDYQNLSKIMFLYQEYIRNDFKKKNKLYRAEYAYYTFTSPIVEWAQIGGLAVLWGEFHGKSEWMQRVRNGSNAIFVMNEEKSNLPEKLIKFIQNRNNFMLGIGGRDILETRWQQSVENAISESCICESEYGMYGVTLKTDSKLLKAFCPNFLDLGFTTDPSEVFWVMCVNPYLHKEKRFKTSNSWDEEMKDV